MSDVSHQVVRLGRGKHSSPDQGACVMELASMLAGERFGDRPRAVCPVIGAFLRTYNDALDDDRRLAAAGEFAARAAARDPDDRGDHHRRALAFVDELIALGARGDQMLSAAELTTGPTALRR